MKQILLYTIISIFLFEYPSYAQDCSGLPLFKQGKQFVFKDEGSPSTSGVSGRTTKKIYMIDSVNMQGGQLHASIKDLSPDRTSQGGSQKRSISDTHFTGIFCDGHSISYVTSVKSASMSFVIVSEFPMHMKVGEKFKDQVIKLTKSEEKKSILPDITIIVHRSVVGEESLTTDAGKWNCFKIAETTSSIIASPNGGPPNTINNPDITYTWFSFDIGVVKIVTVNFRTLTLIGLP
jgi:hypothetical protein